MSRPQPNLSRANAQTSNVADLPPIEFPRYSFSRSRVNNWAAHLQKRVDEDIARAGGTRPCGSQEQHSVSSKGRSNRSLSPRSPDHSERTDYTSRSDRFGGAPNSARRGEQLRTRYNAPIDRYTSERDSRTPRSQNYQRDRDADGDANMEPITPRRNFYQRDNPRSSSPPSQADHQSSPGPSTSSPISSRFSRQEPAQTKQKPTVGFAPMVKANNGSTFPTAPAAPTRNSNPSPREVIEIAESSSESEAPISVNRRKRPAPKPAPSIADIARMTRKAQKPAPSSTNNRSDRDSQKATLRADSENKRLKALSGSSKVSKSSGHPLSSSSLAQLPRVSKAQSQTGSVAGSRNGSSKPASTAGSSRTFSKAPVRPLAIPNLKNPVRPAEQDRKAVFPRWYLRAPRTQVRPKPGQRESETSLFQLRDILERILDLALPPKSSTNLTKVFDELRTIVHRIPFVPVDIGILRRTSALNRLAVIFDPSELVLALPELAPAGRVPDAHEARDFELNFPWDIQADAFELFNKWAGEDFEHELLRHLVFPTKIPAIASSLMDDNSSSGVSLDPRYIKKQCSYYGSGLLTNGQWFARQLAALRDGAHGATQAGIHGAKGQGAFSIVLSAGKYDDRDDGDTILYSGTIATSKMLEKNSDANGELITEGTQRLMESFKSRRPVRVIRSENLDSKYAPEQGFRYDGEYEVVGWDEKKMVVPASDVGGSGSGHETVTVCLFTLCRKPNQDPIRYQGPERRPTKEEKEQYAKELQMIKFKGSSL